MKLSILQKHKTKLFKLKILNTKIHKSQKNFDYLLFTDMETRLKKILHIIYKFHAANKKILFVGTPLKLNNQIKQLLRGKKHSFIPESIWMSGIITNASSSFKYLIKRHAINNDKTSKLLFSLKNQADLIVVLNESFNITALAESSLKRVPTISLNTTYNVTDLNLSTYKVPGNYSFNEKKIRSNIFFLFLGSLLKKAERVRKRQIRVNMVLKERKLERKKFKKLERQSNKNYWKKTRYKRHGFV